MARGDIGFFGAVAFLGGIFGASFGISVYVLLGMGYGAAILYSIVQQSRKHVYLLFLMPLFIGFFYFHLYLNVRAAQESIPFGEKIAFSGQITAEPKFSESTQVLTVQLNAPYAGTIRVLVSPIPEYHYGDVLGAEGVIKLRMNPGDLPLAAFPKVSVHETGGGSKFLAALINVKQGFIRSFQRFLSGDAGALMAGLTFGAQSDFSKDFKGAMSASGTTHLVALSGYNVAIITVALGELLRRFMRRRHAFFVTLAMLILFILMVGGEASVVRAAIMGLLLLFAREVGRGYNIRNAIIFTAALMTLFDPTILRWSIGFQLSFLSLLGIVYLEPALGHILKAGKRKWFGLFVVELQTTFAAQLAVAPLLMAYFGSFSFTSLIANMLILPFIPLTMFAGFVMAGVGLVLPFLTAIIAWGANIFLSYEVFVIRAGAHFAIPISSSSSTVLTVAYTLVLIVFAVWGWNKKSDDEMFERKV